MPGRAGCCIEKQHFPVIACKEKPSIGKRLALRRFPTGKIKAFGKFGEHPWKPVEYRKTRRNTVVIDSPALGEMAEIKSISKLLFRQARIQTAVYVG